MVAGYIPFDAGRSAPRELPERVFIELPRPNVSPVERALTLAAGLAVAFEGLRRRRKLGTWMTAASLLGGGVVVARAIGGYCPIEAHFQNKREADERRLGPHEGRVRQFLPRILRSISIRASREEIVSRLGDLPNVDGVRFEILGQPNVEEILWQAQKLPPIGNAPGLTSPRFGGVIRLIDGPPNKGVELQASIDDVPEGLTSDDVESTIRRVLRSLKQFIEAGEIATTSGQSHGRRKFSITGSLSHLVHKLMNKEELRHVGAVLERN